MDSAGARLRDAVIAGTVLLSGITLVAAIIGSLGLAQSRKTVAPADPVIETARKAAAAFTASLPKYFVKRTTTRYESPRPTCSAAAIMSNPDGCGERAMQAWSILDVVTADVVTDNGKEEDIDFKVNGKPASEKDVDLGGAWSEGDFAGTLQAILSPESAAAFTKKHAVTIVKRPAFRYEYSIDQPHSSWHLSAGTSTYSTAYTGLIWFDQATSRALRIEMSARNLPESFPSNKIDWSLDYDFVKIGDGTYLLPKHSETQDCSKDNSICNRNATDFQNYRKYIADSSISFGENTK